MLSHIIGVLKEATNLPVVPFATEDIETCIVYEYETSSDSGVVSIDKLTVRIIAFSIGEALRIEKQIKKALLTKGDATGRIKHIELNGGGLLEEKASKTFHKLGFYYITYKSEV